MRCGKCACFTSRTEKVRAKRPGSPARHGWRKPALVCARPDLLDLDCCWRLRAREGREGPWLLSFCCLLHLALLHQPKIRLAVGPSSCLPAAPRCTAAATLLNSWGVSPPPHTVLADLVRARQRSAGGQSQNLSPSKQKTRLFLSFAAGALARPSQLRFIASEICRHPPIVPGRCDLRNTSCI